MRRKMICKKCGYSMPDQAKFCPGCGEKVEDEFDHIAQALDGEVERTIAKAKDDVYYSEAQENQVQQPVSRTGVPIPQEIPVQTAMQGSAINPGVQSMNDVQGSSINPGVQNLNGAQETQHVNPMNSMQEKPSKKWNVLTAVGAVVLLLVSGVLTAFFVNKSNSERNAALRAEVQKTQQVYLDFKDAAQSYKKTYGKFYFDDEDAKTYEQQMKLAKEYIEKQADAQQMEQWKTKMEAFGTHLQRKNEEKVSQLQEQVEEISLIYATDAEVKQYETYQKDIKKLVKEGNYGQAIEQSQKWETYAQDISEEKYGYNVNVLQQDLSAYPKVRLYVDVTDQDEEVVENLDKKYFVLSERQGSDTEYMRMLISKATQLNQEESLNISMVADNSGSMDMSMSEVVEVMENFLETVQFDVGDQIELSRFQDDYEILQYFTDDRQTLIDQVEQMYASGGTKLYDSLIEATQRVYLQEGAKCVIAFTDGMDNCSASTEDDVIRYAQEYDVPIFIIGIGVEDWGYQETLQDIATQTGGFYEDIDSVGDAMEEVYQSIYRQQKEVYCIEYQEDADAGLKKARELSVYVKDEENGGGTTYSYTPQEDYFTMLLGKMLNAFSDSVEEKDDSIVKNAGVMVPGSEVEQGMCASVNSDTLMKDQVLYFEITNIRFPNKNTCIMDTRETYDITQLKNYKRDIKKHMDSSTDCREAYDLLMSEYWEEDLKGKNIVLRKERCIAGHYKLVKNKKGQWKFKNYTGSYDLVDVNVYYARCEGDSYEE